MRHTSIISKTRCAVLGVASVLVMFSQASMAGAYHSTVTLPTVHSKGYTYQAHLPVMSAAPAGAKISRVSWSWNYVGFPRGLVVGLCQGTLSNCKAIPRERNGSTTHFNNRNPSLPFFFTIQVINDRNSSPVPIGGLGGAVTVSW